MWTVLLTIAPAGAAEWVVPEDASSIAAAVGLAQSGDTVVIRAGVYVESVDVTIDLTIVGEPGAVWRADGNDALDVENGATVTVSGVTFDGDGRERSVEVDPGGTATFTDCVFANGSVGGDGGGIRADRAAALTVRDSTFVGNHAGDDGGHLHAYQTPTVTVERSLFVAGDASNDGGALSFDGGGTAEVVDSTVIGNHANDDGGGITVFLQTLDVRGVLLCANDATDDGGGVQVDQATATLRGHLVVANTSDDGGGIHVAQGTVTSTNGHFVGNDVGDDGTAFGGAPVALVSRNDLIAFQGPGDPAFDVTLGDVDHALMFGNAGGEGGVGFGPGTVREDPLLAGWTAGSCDPSGLVPDALGPTVDAGDPAVLDLDGTVSDIGAFGGSAPFAIGERGARRTDADGDRFPAEIDCDDGDAAVSPGAEEIGCDSIDNDCDPETRDAVTEVVADGVDQDCDGGELCWADADGDGRGEPTTVASADLGCEGAGEARAADDVCPGFDDALDADADGAPDLCDPCPLDIADDSDGDGVCDADDGCPGFDDALDADADGAADGCDPCPADPSDDSDGDGVCDSADLCPGFDDTLDADADGAPDGCDPDDTDPPDPPPPSDTGSAPDDGDPGDPPGPGAGGDRDGDGVADAVDPAPDDAGGSSRRAPRAALGCGCAAGASGSTGAWLVPALAIAGALGFRRRGPWQRSGEVVPTGTSAGDPESPTGRRATIATIRFDLANAVVRPSGGSRGPPPGGVVGAAPRQW